LSTKQEQCQKAWETRRKNRADVIWNKGKAGLQVAWNNWEKLPASLSKCQSHISKDKCAMLKEEFNILKGDSLILNKEVRV